MKTDKLKVFFDKQIEEKNNNLVEQSEVNQDTQPLGE